MFCAIVLPTFKLHILHQKQLIHLIRLMFLTWLYHYPEAGTGEIWSVKRIIQRFRTFDMTLIFKEDTQSLQFPS